MPPWWAIVGLVVFFAVVLAAIRFIANIDKTNQYRIATVLEGARWVGLEGAKYSSLAYTGIGS